MIKKIRDILFASEIAALEKQRLELEMQINQRVAEYLAKMDPFEPLLRMYNVVFSKEYDNPEDNLSDQSQFQLFSWAWGVENDPSFKHLVNWLRDTQGNATLRKAANDHEWLYGRAAVATMTLFTKEVSRLASRYKDLVAKKSGEFDEHLPVE